MLLTLTVKSFQRLSPAQESGKSLDQGSLTIGRGDDSDWVLPDPERQISKSHCRVDGSDGRYLLTDISTNGVFVNDQEQSVGRDNQVELQDGDRLRMGDYEIEVAIASGGGGDAFNPDDTAKPLPAAEDPFADDDIFEAPTEPIQREETLGDVPPPSYAGDPFASDLDEAQQAPQTGQPRLLGIPADGATATPEPPPAGATPDHLSADRAFFQSPNLVPDPALPEPELPEPELPKPGAESDGLLKADAGGGAIADDWDEPGDASEPMPDTSVAGAIPDDWSLEPEPPAGAPAQAESPPEPEIEPLQTGQIPDDWEPENPKAEQTTLGPDPAAPADPESSAIPSIAPQPDPAPTEPPLAPEAPPPAQPEIRRPTPGARSVSGGAAATPQSSSRALQAFAQGAQLELPKMSDEDAEAHLRTLGEIYRIVVQGMMEVLAARASVKNEFRVEQTMIQPVQNNPLKFSLSVDNAMENLLVKRGPGYMSPVTAMQEGFSDIQAHQIASLAGMQSALKSVLARFDPEHLGDRLQKSSLLGGLLLGSRKAKYWDTFQSLYREIASEAEDDFQKLFGQAFAEAYEQEIKKKSKGKA